MNPKCIPCASETIGPQSWKADTVRSIAHAEQLVRQMGESKSNFATRRSYSAIDGFASGQRELSRAMDRNAQDEIGILKNNKTTPPAVAKVPRSSLAPFVATFASPFLREQCGSTSVAVAVGYMRSVRGVEGVLRGQAGKMWLECKKLEREQGHLERMLRTVRKNLLVNRKSVEDRKMRPVITETVRDGADSLLDYEKKELNDLKSQLETTLRETLTQLQALKKCSRMVLECANERSRVLDLLPSTGSRCATGRHSIAAFPKKATTVGPYTPECEQIMKSSSVVLNQSRLLRDKIRCVMNEATARQKAALQSVNEGLRRKIEETVSLKERLTMSSAATRQAIHRKDRQLATVAYSHGRALGPVSRGDLMSRERLDRPVVQVYQRHPAPQLPEAMDLVKGTAMLQLDLQSLDGELAQLSGARVRLVEDLHRKEAAAKVDSAVVRLHRRQMRHQGMPSYFLQGTC